MVEHRAPHLLRRADRDQFDAGRSRQVDRTGHEDHTSATAGGCFGDRVSHLSAGAIADVSDGIERFLCWSGGDQNALAFEISPGARESVYLVGDAGGIGEAARTDAAARE